jgi:hypothetical protein
MTREKREFAQSLVKSLLEMDDKLSSLRNKMNMYNDEVQGLTLKVKQRE